ncbi:MAG: group 1 truncated hemoglobin [Myxococcota bacterium]|nr:group 1 truncated hemoglobin [Myxococcota bacterium]
MSESETLYHRVGGEAGVHDLIGTFYQRVFADPELRPFFEGIELEKLERMQREFFAAALDGPSLYTGRPIAEAHYGLGIQPKHLRRYLDHLLATLESTGLSEDDVYGIMDRISRIADEITGTTSVDG